MQTAEDLDGIVIGGYVTFHGVGIVIQRLECRIKHFLYLIKN